MDLFVLIGSFFLLLFLGVPIAFALCSSSILYLVLYCPNIPLIIEHLDSGDIPRAKAFVDGALRRCGV